MDHATQIRLIERLFEHIDARTTDCAPNVATCPVAHYLDPERYDEELATLFTRGPVCVAHATSLAEPGDFITLDVGSRPLLLVRDGQRRLGAFLNVCRHRGSRVVDQASGRGCSQFRCPYHGWSYGNDGALVGVPHRGGFAGVDLQTHGLRTVSVWEHADFVWVGTDAQQPDSLRPLGEQLDQQLTGHVVYDPRVADYAMNWKLAIDIFLEAYHLRTTHAESIFPLFFDNVAITEYVGAHQRTVIPKRSLNELRGTDPAQWRLRSHANVLLQLFPNTLVLLESDHADVLHVFPTGAATCRVRSYTLIPEPPDDKACAYWDANNDILYRATSEDFARGESIQRGLNSGANEVLTFGRFEHGLAHFHAGVDNALTRGP